MNNGSTALAVQHSATRILINRLQELLLFVYYVRVPIYIYIYIYIYAGEYDMHKVYGGRFS